MNIDKEYLEFLIKNSIEEKTAACLSKSLRKTNMLFATVLILMLFVVIGAKYLVGKGLETQLNVTLTQRFDELETKYSSALEHKLLYISAINELTTAYTNHPSEVELEHLIGTIYKLHNNYHRDKDITLEPLVFKLSSLLTATKHTRHLVEISELFNDIIVSSVRINNIFVNYYGKKVLASTINIHDNQFKQYYNAFTQHVEYSKDLRSEKDILSILMLVNFHISGQMRSENTTQLIQYLNTLSSYDKAYFLVDLTKNIDQAYKNQMDYYNTAKITREFMRLYKNELEQIMYTDGVKEELLKSYKSASSDKESIKYKLTLNTLYNFGL